MLSISAGKRTLTMPPFGRVDRFAYPESVYVQVWFYIDLFGKIEVRFKYLIEMKRIRDSGTVRNLAPEFQQMDVDDWMHEVDEREWDKLDIAVAAKRMKFDWNDY